jgi:XTP/dITP diphosphohydrolase
MKLLLATLNTHKIKEIQELSDLEFILKPGFNVIESGKTLKENAYLKAKAYYDAYHIASVSDDSGLFIRALGLAPGVNSKRFTASQKDIDNNNRVLSLMKKHTIRRSAYYKCCVCLYNGTNDVHFFYGKLKGTIGNKIQGGGGFGYDSIFIPKRDKVYLSQMSLKDKNKISHRAKAFIKLSNYLKKRGLK